MELASSENTSVFDILRSRMGMPPIELVIASPQTSNSRGRQMIDAVSRYWPAAMATIWKSLWLYFTA